MASLTQVPRHLWSGQGGIVQERYVKDVDAWALTCSCNHEWCTHRATTLINGLDFPPEEDNERALVVPVTAVGNPDECVSVIVIAARERKDRVHGDLRILLPVSEQVDANLSGVPWPTMAIQLGSIKSPVAYMVGYLAPKEGRLVIRNTLIEVARAMYGRIPPCNHSLHSKKDFFGPRDPKVANADNKNIMASTLSILTRGVCRRCETGLGDDSLVPDAVAPGFNDKFKPGPKGPTPISDIRALPGRYELSEDL